MSIRAALLLGVVLLLGQGCSTVLHGTTQPLMITTVPAGATATIGMQSCVTPCSLLVKRDSQSLSVRKGSYSRTFDLEKDFRLGSTICGNICWLLPGAIIDVAAGGAYEIRPVNLNLDLSDEPAKVSEGRE